LLIYDDKPNVLIDDIRISGHSCRVPKLENLAGPSAVILNVGDWAYCTQTYSEDCLKYLTLNTDKLEKCSTLAKMVIIRNLNEMTRKGHFDPRDFIQFAKNLV